MGNLYCPIAIHSSPYYSQVRSTSEIQRLKCTKQTVLRRKEPAQKNLSEPIQSRKPVDVQPADNMLALEEYAGYYSKGSLALIKPSCKLVTQQGTAYLGQWELKFDSKPRWENTTMGWCSSGHSYSNLSLLFPDKGSAIDFAKKRGWQISVEEEQKKPKFRPKRYSEIFSYDRRTRASTK